MVTFTDLFHPRAGILFDGPFTVERGPSWLVERDHTDGVCWQLDGTHGGTVYPLAKRLDCIGTLERVASGGSSGMEQDDFHLRHVFELAKIDSHLERVLAARV